MYQQLQMIYYCVNDALLLTNPFALIENEIEEYGTIGVFLLWPLVICHTMCDCLSNNGPSLHHKLKIFFLRSL